MEQGYLLPILGQLRIPALVSLVLAVIYNICLDYGMHQNHAWAWIQAPPQTRRS